MGSGSAENLRGNADQGTSEPRLTYTGSYKKRVHHTDCEMQRFSYLEYYLQVTQQT